MARARGKPTAAGDGNALKLKGVRFRWPGTRGFQIEIDDLRIDRGRRVLLLGPSGSGKSTLLNLLCGIVAPERGAIEVLGQDITAMGPTERDSYRADHIGIIFQMFNLLPYANAIDNVIVPLNFSARRRERVTDKSAPDREARRLLTALGIDEGLATKGTAAQLSIGQQQRVAVARALIGGPEIIVADEPTSALDGKAQNRFLDLLFEQAAKSGTTLLMVSHDERLSKRFDRVLSLGDIAAISEAA